MLKIVKIKFFMRNLNKKVKKALNKGPKLIGFLTSFVILCVDSNFYEIISSTCRKF